MLGFIKRIGIAAVLSHVLDELMGASAAEISVPIAILALIMLCAQVYFTLSGYSDMACGILYMFGLPHKPDFRIPFAGRGYPQYYHIFFASLNTWLNDYLVKPILHKKRIPAKLRRLAAHILFCVVFSLWLKTSWYVCLVILPILVVRLLRLGVSKRLTKRFPIALRHGSEFLLSVILFSLFWSAVAIPYGENIAEFVSRITFSGGYMQLGILYPELSYLRYLMIGIVGLLCMIPLSQQGSALLARLPRWISRVTLTVGWFGLLAVFVVAIIQLLPNFPQYTETAFRYLIL